MRRSDKVLYGLLCVFGALLSVYHFCWGGVMLACGLRFGGALSVIAGLAASVCVAFGCMALIKNYLEERK